MEILNIKISRFTDIISGVKLYENDDLLIIIQNPVDYVLDGVCFINKKYIQNMKLDEDHMMKKILEHKISKYNINNYYRNFKNIKDTIDYFKDNQSKLIELTLDSPTYSIIGKIQNVNIKSFKLNMLSVKAQYLNEEKFEYDKIRILTIDSDYLNSLEYFMSL
ncbi:hypothetical protein [Chryseobacterium defluvii]|uniref:Uncharacterized protein n=1 Tax=Chryseobacterium defluvii TaxID=160396 RepID=A0A495SE31_9FLAO|nr:hypothetical protein [Chryseobacterium defluvii]RKS98126.1 hypothetical protein BCF58_2265 [Chryseobacterium defluvii]